jgi:DNA-directed RNA polymerase subunit alpha
MYLDTLNLSVKTYNYLKRAGIDTVENLCDMTEDDMMRVRNLGRKSLQETIGVMKDRGLKFSEGR